MEPRSSWRSNELIGAIPVMVPDPFDPSYLELGDQIHMKDGDVINFLWIVSWWKKHKVALFRLCAFLEERNVWKILYS